MSAWRHGSAQRLPEYTSRAARARHEVNIESLTYKFILAASDLVHSPVPVPVPPCCKLGEIRVIFSDFCHKESTSEVSSTIAVRLLLFREPGLAWRETGENLSCLLISSGKPCVIAWCW